MLIIGDSLFKYSQDSSTAKITWLQSNFLSYVNAYHYATLTLLEKSEHDPGSFENTFQTIPIISSVRHSIELMLKTILHRAGEVLGKEEMKNHMHHKIDKLWIDAQSSLSEIGVTRQDDQVKIVTNIISILCQYDPLSFSFRYPFDKRMSNPSLDGVKDINIPNMKDVYLRLRDFFMDIVVEIYHLPDATDFQ